MKKIEQNIKNNEIQTFRYEQIEKTSNNEVSIDLYGRRYRGVIVKDYPNLKEMEVIIF